MSIIKLNNRSVKDITAFGSISSLGSLTHIATQTASSSASLNFTSGIDSTYKEYIFYFVNMHPASDSVSFDFNLSTDGGSNYNVTKTTTLFRTSHDEADSYTQFGYNANEDLAQSTSDQHITYGIGNGSDESASGIFHLFNPSSTTFVKHFISTACSYAATPGVNEMFVAGYGNTTSAVDAVQFKMSSGNIDSGQILLFGLN
jgi:hypothetical protein